MENYTSFDHFTMNTWQYLSNRSQRAWNIMSEKERRDFNFDVTTIDWMIAEKNFLFGIRRFFLKEDILPPEASFKQLLVKDRAEPFHDFRVAFNNSKVLTNSSNEVFFDGILSHDRFNAYLEQKSHMFEGRNLSTKKHTKPKNPQDAAYVGKETSALSFNRLLAVNQLKEMRVKITLNGMRLLMYYYNKKMRKSMQGLYVDTKGIDMVKRMIKSGYKVIFMPLYKTYIDFLVLTYVHQMQGIPHGFTLGNFEDTPRIVFFDAILRSVGYIMSRRK